MLRRIDEDLLTDRILQNVVKERVFRCCLSQFFELLLTPFLFVWRVFLVANSEPVVVAVLRLCNETVDKRTKVERLGTCRWLHKVE